jgi:hypothetical protein
MADQGRSVPEAEAPAPIRVAAGPFVRLEFKPEDMWVGAFWRVLHFPSGNREWNLWICLVPMLPIHIHWWRNA